MPTHEKFDPLLEEVIEQVTEKARYIYHGSQMPLKDVQAYETMKSLKGDEKVELIFFLLAKVNSLLDKIVSYIFVEHNAICYTEQYHIHEKPMVITANLVYMIFRTRIEFSDSDFVQIFQHFGALRRDVGKNRAVGFSFSNWPLTAFAMQIEKHVKKHGLSEELKADIETMLQKEELKIALKNTHKSSYGADLKKAALKLQAIISPEDENTVPEYQLGSGTFGAIVEAERNKLSDEEKDKWNKLFHHLVTASAGKPTKKWLMTMNGIKKEIGAALFKKKLQNWLEQASKLEVSSHERISTYGTNTYTYQIQELFEEHSHNLIKGMLWSMSSFHDAKSLQIIASLAEKCFVKIPGRGPAAAGVGNAAIYALAQSKGLEGVGHLSRLKLRIKQNNTQKIIQKYIEEQAEKQGLNPAQIEEAAAPDFCMVKGERVEAFKDYHLTLRLTGIGKTVLVWTKPDGKVQKTVPAFVKSSKPLTDKLKTLRDIAKQVKTNSTAQRDRIDRLYTEDMSWSVEDVKKHYLEHGLVGFIGQKLIWLLDDTPALYRDEKWEDVKGKPVKTTKTTVVKLWHPIHSATDEILAWRDRLEELEIRQPLKQAYREIYLLTDAEINTRVYSNRMAAHFIKQHQFNTLAAIRGWKYSLLGAYDDGRDGEIARKPLPAHNLEAQFWINEVYDENENWNDAGIYYYVSTDQVRFHKLQDTDDNPVEMVNIPPLVLSEILRDVDLFVGVASVGNDPTWQDGGPDARPEFRDYWQTYSFGDLTEVAKTRKSVLERLLPRLKIRDVAHIEGKFLIVDGKKHTYKIHIGSTNILIAPDDRYLCIVPGRGKDKNVDKLFLPFEGDNGFSILLSKAFMLAEDDKITDKTILSQL